MTQSAPAAGSIEQRRFDPEFSGPRFLAVGAEDCSALLACDVVVVGGGVAGLSAALEAAHDRSVLLVTKGPLEESNTRYAQGGIAAVLGSDDSFEAHVADTVKGGAGLCHEAVARTVVEGGPAAIQRLIELGGRFDLSGSEIALALEGGHTRGRVVHARGDATGLEVQSVLTARVRAEPRIRILEHTFAVDLITAGGAVSGVIVLPATGGFTQVRCNAVVLASGGAGQIYRESTNPSIATGDGVALAFRAGARLRGVEFVQFHPTALYVPGLPRLLVSETVRGEGGVLRDRSGRPVMEGVHPQGDLAPRDVVSRAALRRMLETGDSCVYLDVRHFDPAYFRRRFPGIARALDQYGIDFATEPIPVHPAAHYFIGGVVADVDGATSLPGLYACGEVSSTGLHGANRLGSNSLLEGLVCGLRAGIAASAKQVTRLAAFDDGSRPEKAAPPDIHYGDFWNSLRSILWKRVSIERNAEGLRFARERLEEWSQRLFRFRFADPRGLELANALTVARLVTAAATVREESRGTHYRADFPERDDARWGCDLVLERAGG